MTDEKRTTLTRTSLYDDSRTDRELILQTNRLVQQLARNGVKTLSELERAMYIVHQPISALKLSSKTESSLANAGVVTVRDLLSHTEGALIQIEHIGRLAKNEIVEVLSSHGIRLSETTQAISSSPVSDVSTESQPSKSATEKPNAEENREVSVQPHSEICGPIRRGDVVEHPTKHDWGIGKVQYVASHGIATIIFADAGEKNIDLSAIQLTKLQHTSDAPELIVGTNNERKASSGKALCTNCGQPTLFTDQASLGRFELGWCDACFKHSQRTFNDSVTGEKRYYDELRTLDGIKSRYSQK